MVGSFVVAGHDIDRGRPGDHRHGADQRVSTR
jgi:hypothetical protein